MMSLYICYQSLLDPLTQTQVVAYLEGLAQAGYPSVLMTFEPDAVGLAVASDWEERLAAKGIVWHRMRYHKRPTVPATAWDVAAGVAAGLSLMRKHRIWLVHARSHVPALMGLALKRLTGTKLLFDVRGLLAEEYVDAGTWPAGGALFRTTKRVERHLVAGADGFVVLTHKAEAMLREWYPREFGTKPFQVIPTCVDTRRYPRGSEMDKGPCEENVRGNVIVYVGKLGGWYDLVEMINFIKAAAVAIPDLRWQVWTQSDPRGLVQSVADVGLEDRVEVGSASVDELPGKLAGASAALTFTRPSLSKKAMSPTKIGEYLAAGLPVITNAGVGDVDDLLAKPVKDGAGPIGILVEDFTPTGHADAVERLKAMLEDPTVRDRCRAVAWEYFDLQRVGWDRYSRLYRDLSGGARACGGIGTPSPTGSEPM